MWSQERDGKYRFFESYKDPMTDKRVVVSVTMAKNTRAAQKEAREKLEDIIAARMSQAGHGIQGDYTLHELIEAYLLEQEKTVRTATMLQNKYALSVIERDILGPDVLVNRMTAPYIKGCLLRSGEDAVRMNERLKHLKALLRWGYEADYIQDITWLGKLKRFKEDTSYIERIEDKYLEQKQVDALIDGMQVERWQLLTRALVLSGLRPGEFYALTDADVDFEKQLIKINKSYNPISKEVTPPKTYSSKREIRMQPELYKAMYAIKKSMQRQAKRYGYLPRGIFFCAEDGGYISHFAYVKYFRENTEKILGQRYTPYVLRHTHVSLLAAAGVPLDTVARRVGHESSKITKRIYFHVTDNLRDRENAILDEIKLLKNG